MVLSLQFPLLSSGQALTIQAFLATCCVCMCCVWMSVLSVERLLKPAFILPPYALSGLVFKVGPWCLVDH